MFDYKHLDLRNFLELKLQCLSDFAKKHKNLTGNLQLVVCYNICGQLKTVDGGPKEEANGAEEEF